MIFVVGLCFVFLLMLIFELLELFFLFMDWFCCVIVVVYVLFVFIFLGVTATFGIDVVAGGLFFCGDV